MIMNHLFTLPITPIAAPRQVNSDRWHPSDRVIRYREWRDEVTLLLIGEPQLPDRPYFIFDLPMPKEQTDLIVAAEYWHAVNTQATKELGCQYSKEDL